MADPFPPALSIEKRCSGVDGVDINASSDFRRRAQNSPLVVDGKVETVQAFPPLAQWHSVRGE